MKIIENPRYIAAIVISIGIAYISYVYFLDKPAKEQLNRQILKDALEKYVLEGDTNQKDAYGTKLKYDARYNEFAIIITIESAGATGSFEDKLTNSAIWWIVGPKELEGVPPEDHLKTGAVSYEGYMYQMFPDKIVTYP